MPDAPSDPTQPPPPDSDVAQALDELEKVLLRIGGAATLLKDVRDLRDLLVKRRPPRVAAIGRRGSGKSTLANALMGFEVLETGAVADTTHAPAWIELDYQGKKLRWLDTPGLRAGDSPTRRDQVRRVLAEEPPDVVLVTARATQVDAGIDEDLAEVSWLLERQKSVGLLPPAVIAVVTRVDEMAPVTQKAPPFGDEKRANIDKAVALLRGHLDRAKITAATVVPVGAYQRFFKDHTVAVDWRWNLDALASSVFAALPAAAQVEAARAFQTGQSLRRKVAQRVVHAATSLAFFIGTTPLPIADLAILAPLQSVMITGVMFISGRRGDARSTGEWLASLGVNASAGYALREGARALIKLLPGLGGALSGAIAASGTWALGMSAIRYFIDGASAEEARRAFEAARRDGPPPQLTGGTQAPALGEPSRDATREAGALPEPVAVGGEPARGGEPPPSSGSGGGSPT